MSFRNWLVGFALASLTAPHVATAQEALYGPQPPKGSAYVRFVNALGGEADVKPDFLPAQHLGAASSDRVGDYFVVERVTGRPLKVDMHTGDRHGQAIVQAEPGGFLTIVLEPADGDGIRATPIADLSGFNQNRARLSFYNASQGCDGGSLALQPGGQAVFSAVPAGASKARAVNPVAAELLAGCTDQTAPPVTLAGMEPGSMFSVWLMVNAGKPSAFVTRDVATPYRK